MLKPLPALPSPSTLSSLLLISSSSSTLRALCFVNSHRADCSPVQLRSVDLFALPRTSVPITPPRPIDLSFHRGSSPPWLHRRDRHPMAPLGFLVSSLISRHSDCTMDLQSFICDSSLHPFWLCWAPPSLWLHLSPSSTLASPQPLGSVAPPWSLGPSV